MNGIPILSVLGLALIGLVAAFLVGFYCGFFF
jgi:hypothetical protein